MGCLAMNLPPALMVIHPARSRRRHGPGEITITDVRVISYLETRWLRGCDSISREHRLVQQLKPQRRSVGVPQRQAMAAARPAPSLLPPTAIQSGSIPKRAESEISTSVPPMRSSNAAGKGYPCPNL